MLPRVYDLAFNWRMPQRHTLLILGSLGALLSSPVDLNITQRPKHRFFSSKRLNCGVDLTCWILIGQSEASGDASGASSGDTSRLGITRGGAGGHT